MFLFVLFDISLIHLLLSSLLLLLLLNVIYTDFSVCVISCRKLGSKTLVVASGSITFILDLMKIGQLAQNLTVFGH